MRFPGCLALPPVLARHPPELSIPPQFLSLDDLSDSRANVDLRSDQAPSVSAPLLRLADGGVGRWCHATWVLMVHPLLASVQETLIVPLLPMALVAPDETEKNSNPLYRCGPEPGGWRVGCAGEGSL